MRKNMVLLTAFICLTLNLNGQISQQPTKDNTLLVRGMAILKATPEILIVRIDIDSEDEKYNKCQELLIKKIEKTKSHFIKNGIAKESIHTNKLNVAEKRLYLANNNEKIVFAGRASFIIEHPYSIEYATKILTGLRNDSLAVHYNMAFTLSEEQKSELRKKAIAVALEDAREKALAIASGAKVKLLKINSINYTDAEYGSYSIDSDLVRENDLSEQQVFANIGSTGQKNNTIDFNPKEIGIKKVMTVEWLIEEN
jgi:uncharacterized protein YggE